jgi:hypothetical protein
LNPQKTPQGRINAKRREKRVAWLFAHIRAAFAPDFAAVDEKLSKKKS